MVKKCKTHGSSPANKQNRCKKCASEAVARRRRLVKLKAIKYKGGACAHCGYNKCVAALSFHHNDPTQKDFSLSKSGHCRSWAKVKEEIDKCTLLCHNCHTEVHTQIFENSNPNLVKRLSNYQEYKPVKHKCMDCSKQVKKAQSKCLSCHKKSIHTKINWPSTSELITMVNKTSYSAVGRKLGVSDNAVRKRIKNH